MATKIVIPEVGESVTSGVIAAWAVPDGGYVERDETVLELETDKITMEVPAPASGVVSHAAAEGDEVDVGAVVGEIDESADAPQADDEGQSAQADQDADQNEKQDEKSDQPAKAARASEGSGGSDDSGGAAVAQQERAGKSESTPKSESKSGSKSETKSKSDGAADRAPARSAGGPVHATPVAEKIAHDHGVELGAVVGTGAGGRIREQDVLAYLQSGSRAGDRGDGSSANGSAAPAADTSPAGERRTHREKMTPLRQRVANRLVEAQHTAAMLTTFNEVDMTAVMALRKRYKEDFEKRHGVNLGFMSFFVRAVVQGLRAYPLVNGFIAQDEQGKPVIQTHDYCDVAIAVASPKGLVVPVVRNAERLSFAEIESTIKELATKARDGKLTLEEMTGGTFTITNGGVFGSLMSTPILNPPQSAILGMHTIKNRAVEDPDNPGQLALRPMMYLAVSYDHRIIDGAEAVRFLVTVKDCIEHPERMLIGL